MKTALLLAGLLLPCAARAGDLGGHKVQKDLIGEPLPADERKATLDEMWQRRLLAPDQSSWAPSDYELLQKIRRAEGDALTYLKRRFGSVRDWSVMVKAPGAPPQPRLTKEGYEKFVFLYGQDAIGYFETKGAEAKWVFKLRDMDGRLLFEPGGRITEEGMKVYRRAQLNLEVFWTGGDGRIFGTRKPPTKTP